MANIHNNEIMQRGAFNRGMKPAGAENESNGMGSPGYSRLENEEDELDDLFVDKSSSLMDALACMAFLNSSKLYVKNKYKFN
jgi:hypothetical protein